MSQGSPGVASFDGDCNLISENSIWNSSAAKSSKPEMIAPIQVFIYLSDDRKNIKFASSTKLVSLAYPLADMS